MDMSHTIIAKSDQLNADDLVGGPRTITITRVTGNEGNAEQPVNVFFEGDNGRPFRPCKTVRRVMVSAWGKEAAQYTGRSMTIYNDPKVKWGGMLVGGIRISHMSHIDREMQMVFQETKGKKTPIVVKPLAKTETKTAPQTANGDKAGDNQPSDPPSSGNAPAPESISFTSWGGEVFDYPRTLAGIEEYVAAFKNAFNLAVDKGAWFKDNEKIFHELAMGAVGSRAKSARCEKLAAQFDALSSLINETLTGGTA